MAEPEVDISALMDEVRQSVREKKAAGIYRDEDIALPPDFRIFLPPDENDRFALLRAIGHLDLEGDPITSHRPVVGTVVKGTKRTVRYWVRKYTDGVFLRQNQFNAGVVQEMEQLRRKVDDLTEELEKLKK